MYDASQADIIKQAIKEGENRYPFFSSINSPRILKYLSSISNQVLEQNPQRRRRTKKVAIRVRWGDVPDLSIKYIAVFSYQDIGFGQFKIGGFMVAPVLEIHQEHTLSGIILESVEGGYISTVT